MTSQARLPVEAPFHLEATVRVLQRRPGNRVDVWKRDRYIRVLPTPDGPVLIDVKNCGTIDEPDVRFTIRAGSSARASYANVGTSLRSMLGLDVDPEPFQRLVMTEPELCPTAFTLRGMRPSRFVGLFEAFASVVPFQQVSLDAGIAVLRRFVERFGQALEHRGGQFYAFPTSETIAGARPRELRACGLSARKARTLCVLGQAIASGDLDQERIARMTTDEALQAFTRVPGIGPWSAALVLLRGFGRLDVFPPGDVGAMRTLGALMHLDPGAPLCAVIERFGNLRGYLYFFVLGRSLVTKRLISVAVDERVPCASADP